MGSELRTEILEAIEDFPVIDCHDHTMGPDNAPEYREPITALIQGYFQSDLTSAGGEPVMGKLNNQDVPTDEKWPIFEKLWKRTQHTGYARVTKIIMKEFYGEEEMSLPAVKRIGEKLLELKNERVYASILEEAGIKCRLVNVYPDIKKFISGEHKIYPLDRLLIPLPGFHAVRSHGNVEGFGKIVNESVTDLDGYLEVCLKIFRGMKDAGAIGFKDQSAYSRTIRYENAPRSEAEKLFNFMMEDPRRSLGWPEARPLDDFLFHSFMGMAEELDLPVQIHTGHMAGIRNDIVKTNAANFTSVLELHRNVKFDLFHGNWPYLGELLYLGKNYPNVALDCCWVNIIDPLYTEQLMYNSLVTVPHSKIHGFGADYGDVPEYAAGHLKVARDVISGALARAVRRGWLDRDHVESVAADWLFNNPNQFFGLGFEPFEP
ncbi:MAG: amidohydrolase family protein [Theionarchaea archaeon]|nr:amidohydrolase family protein [Theionarchaea archaeon]